MDDTLTTCTTCGGIGTEPLPRWAWDADPDTLDGLALEPCGRCAGDGRVPALPVGCLVLDTWRCDVGSAYLRVVFEPSPDQDARAAAWVAARRGTHVVQVAEDNDRFVGDLLGAILYPTCSHGLSADLCAGPNHYPADGA